jgi:hypothetical protein
LAAELRNDLVGNLVELPLPISIAFSKQILLPGCGRRGDPVKAEPEQPKRRIAGFCAPRPPAWPVDRHVAATALLAANIRK